MQRRTFLGSLLATPCILNWSLAADALPKRIIDTHQHLWDLKRQRLPWLSGAPEILRNRFDLEEYRTATSGLPVEAIYMEVDVHDEDLDSEVAYVVKASQERNPTRGAVIGGRPGGPGFNDYLQRHKANSEIKGLRRVLHTDATPPGTCRQPAFIKDMQRLGEIGWSFDLCMRPTELDDAEHLVGQCPGTRFVLDHCGNPDLQAWQPAVAGKPPKHTANEWMQSIDRLAKRPNVICKISGVIANLPQGAGPEYLAPAINHCLNSFGPDRVVFGGDWPVCLLGAPLKTWIEMLTQIIASRPEQERDKLWWRNAASFYRV